MNKLLKPITDMTDLLDQFKSLIELEQTIPTILKSPRDMGTVELIVCRPHSNHREILATAHLDAEQGLVGDNWKANENKFSYYINYQDAQIALINARVMQAITNDKQQWPMAGDQFYVDFDLSTGNTPPGTQLSIGSAIIEITAEPHLPCGKFAKRFGRDAAMFVKSDELKQLNLRGLYAKVIVPGNVDLNSHIKIINISL